MNISLTLAKAEMEMAMKTLKDLDPTITQPNFGEMKIHNRMMHVTLKKMDNGSYITIISIDEAVSLIGIGILNSICSNVKGAVENIGAIFKANDGIIGYLAGETTIEVDGKTIDPIDKVRVTKKDKNGNRVTISRRTTKSKAADEASVVDKIVKKTLKSLGNETEE